MKSPKPISSTCFVTFGLQQFCVVFSLFKNFRLAIEMDIQNESQGKQFAYYIGDFLPLLNIGISCGIC